MLRNWVIGFLRSHDTNKQQSDVFVLFLLAVKDPLIIKHLLYPSTGLPWRNMRILGEINYYI